MSPQLSYVADRMATKKSPHHTQYFIIKTAHCGGRAPHNEVCVGGFKRDQLEKDDVPRLKLRNSALWLHGLQVPGLLLVCCFLQCSSELAEGIIG